MSWLSFLNMFFDFTNYNQYDYLHFTNPREGKGGGKDEF